MRSEDSALRVAVKESNSAHKCMNVFIWPSPLKLTGALTPEELKKKK